MLSKYWNEGELGYEMGFHFSGVFIQLKTNLWRTLASNCKHIFLNFLVVSCFISFSYVGLYRDCRKGASSFAVGWLLAQTIYRNSSVQRQQSYDLQIVPSWSMLLCFKHLKKISSTAKKNNYLVKAYDIHVRKIYLAGSSSTIKAAGLR